MRRQYLATSYNMNELCSDLEFADMPDMVNQALVRILTPSFRKSGRTATRAISFVLSKKHIWHVSAAHTSTHYAALEEARTTYKNLDRWYLCLGGTFVVP